MYFHPVYWKGQEMTDPLIKFVESVCVQTSVYWGSPSPDGYGGYTFADPVEISCRWDGKTQMVKGADGKEVVSRAEIMILQDVNEGGYLYLGELADLDSDEEENPMKLEGAYEILRFDKTPLFQSTSEFVRKAYL
jgi:hypothetical protein